MTFAAGCWCLLQYAHVVIDKLDSGKHAVERDIPRAAFIFQMEADAAVRRGVFTGGSAVQLNAGKSAAGRRNGTALAGQQYIFRKLIWVFHPLITCRS